MRQNLSYFLPELVLIGTILLLFLADFTVGVRKKGLYPLIAFLGLAVMMVANASIKSLAPAHFFDGMVTFDRMGFFFKFVFGTAGLLGILLSYKHPEVERADQPSYYTLMVALVLGMMLLATSN